MKKQKTTTSGRKRIAFMVKANPGSNVSITGSFNKWDTKSKKMVDKNGEGEYSATLMLPRGQYEYKFLINGEWHVDPNCSNWVRNDHGTLNSVIKVK